MRGCIVYVACECVGWYRCAKSYQTFPLYVSYVCVGGLKEILRCPNLPLFFATLVLSLFLFPFNSYLSFLRFRSPSYLASTRFSAKTRFFDVLCYSVYTVYNFLAAFPPSFAQTLDFSAIGKADRKVLQGLG